MEALHGHMTCVSVSSSLVGLGVILSLPGSVSHHVYSLTDFPKKNTHTEQYPNRVCVIAWQLTVKIKPTSVTIAFPSEKQKAMSVLAADDIVYLIYIANDSYYCFCLSCYIFIYILKF